MNKRLTFLILFLLIKLICSAQDDIPVKVVPSEIFRSVKKDPNDTLRWNWKRGGLANLNLAQGSQSNWAAGGDKFSMALTSYVNYFLLNKGTKHTWDNSLDFNFGFLKTTSLGSRKNDDRFDIWSKYGYALSKKWNAAALFNFRTQFANGYTYSGTDKTFSSSFLSPAYLLLGLGLDYKPTENFSVYISPVTTRWVIVNDDTLSAKGLYGVTPGKNTSEEFGALLSAQFIKALSKTVVYKGRLDLFSNYKHNPEKIDVFMTNIFSVKLSKVLAATWNVDFVYDDDVRLFGDDGKSPAWQIKSLVGLGLLVKF